jgi:L-alanine-DL-glutamate epimerase-like enolase superfamily enzyme
MNLVFNLDEKITSIEGFCLSSPYGDGNVYGQPKGVKSLGFIEVKSESGISGFGETYSGIYSPELISPITKYLSHYIIGKKLNSLDFLDKLNKIPFIGYSGLIQSIISGIELAVLDLIGKIEKKPVHKLFQSFDNKEIKCYYSGGSVAFSENEIEEDIQKMKALGFNAFKMRVGLQEWEKDIKRVSKAYEVLKTDKLMVDAIMGTLVSKWTIDDAITKIKNLEKFNLEWIEEPLSPSCLSDYKKLCRVSNIPVAMGEAYSGFIHFENIISNGYADIIQVDATHSMGFRQLLEFSNKTIQNKATHVWGSTLSFYANATLALLSRNIEIHEFPSVEFKISNDIVKEKVKIQNSKLLISDYPGFGIDINDEIKNKYKYIENSGYKT